MKHFIYFSKDAVTSGNALSQGNLMKAGRMDIAIHSLIQGLFLSHDFRTDVNFHFVFYGMPDPPKHIEIQVKEGTPISKKDVSKLIQKILYKSGSRAPKGVPPHSVPGTRTSSEVPSGKGNINPEGKKKEVFPGCFVEKKSFLKVIDDLYKKNVGIFILDKKGEDIRKANIPEDCAFILGDQDGLPKKELTRLKKIATGVSVGPKVYFASQVVAIVNNELDRRF